MCSLRLFSPVRPIEWRLSMRRHQLRDSKHLKRATFCALGFLRRSERGQRRGSSGADYANGTKHLQCMSKMEGIYFSSFFVVCPVHQHVLLNKHHVLTTHRGAGFVSSCGSHAALVLVLFNASSCFMAPPTRQVTP